MPKLLVIWLIQYNKLNLNYYLNYSCRLLLLLQSGNSSQPKAVFFLSSPLGSGHSLDTLRDIVNASCFGEVIVFIAVCSAMHSVIEYGPANVTDDDARAFTLYRNQIQEWLYLRNEVIGIFFFFKFNVNFVKLL